MPLKISAQSAAFRDALPRTGFVEPALVVTYLASGVSLLFLRTAPLGVVLLAPVMVIIFFTDALLDSAWVCGTLHAGVLLALARHFRDASRPLWTYPAAR